MPVLGNALLAAPKAPLGIACIREFTSITSDYMFRKTINIRLPAEDEKVFSRLLEHKTS